MSDLHKGMKAGAQDMPYLDPAAFKTSSDPDVVERQRDKARAIFGVSRKGVSPAVAPPKMTAEARSEHQVEIEVNQSWHRSHFGLGALLAILVLAGALAVDKLVG
jgi:hypothetical protein